MSNCLSRAANLVASGSPTDILHPLPRPRRDLLLAHAYWHLQLSSRLTLLAAPAHLTPSQIPTPSPLGNHPCGFFLPPLPHSISTPPDLQNPGNKPPRSSRFPGSGRDRSKPGLWPRQVCGPLGRRRPLLGRLGYCFTSSSPRPRPAPLTAGFQTSLVPLGLLSVFFL